MRLPLLTFFLINTLLAGAQLSESFADSNFTAAPPWTGVAGAWTVNPQKQLQSASTVANSSFYLSTPNALAVDAQWDLSLRLAFSTSSANYADVWIISRLPNPEAPGNTGYFVRVGGTQDDICLYRKDAAATVKLIDGADGVTGSTDNRLRLRVARRGTTFYLMHAPESAAFTLDGQTADASYAATSYFALLVRQSTASFFGRHFFDDISIAPFIPDTTAPALLYSRAPDDTTVEILFTEPVAGGVTPANFTLAGIGAPRAAAIDPANGALLRLFFASPLPADTPLYLTVRHIRDLWDNELALDTDLFHYHCTMRYDVLIHEILADPDPPRALPAAEYVEIRNRARSPVCLRGWRLATATMQSAPFPDVWLRPDSLLVLTASAHAADFPVPALGLSSFPALDNDGGLIQLLDAAGHTVHALQWSRTWYRDEVKDDGGWSLELIDAGRPCAGAENWRASDDTRGGTPGAPNSMAGTVRDETVPRLLRVYAFDTLRLLAEFSEPLDSARAASAAWLLAGGPTVRSGRLLPPLFRTVELQLTAPLEHGRVYRLRVEGICDCGGNPADPLSDVPVGLAEDAAPGSVVLNELLYQPHTGGAEYVELVVRSGLPDLSRMMLATRNATGGLNTPRRLSAGPLAAFPGEYHVLTSDSADVARSYFVAHPLWLHEVTGLPAFPDDGGSIVLLNDRGLLIDELPYRPDWQFALIDDPHGVALERLNSASATADRHNWHSAAVTAGFGTPTGSNSQCTDAGGEGALTVTPAVFSPDNDGFDDVATVSYALQSAGYVANITIYNLLGRPVCILARNELLGAAGRWTWNGLDEARRPLPMGTYVIFAELFNLDGARKVFKKTVALARRLQ